MHCNKKGEKHLRFFTSRSLLLPEDEASQHKRASRPAI